MKGYSLVKEHPNHFELSHPKDGTFRVSKAQLGAAGTKKARALPKAMADGGEVEGGEADAAPPADAPMGDTPDPTLQQIVSPQPLNPQGDDPAAAAAAGAASGSALHDKLGVVGDRLGDLFSGGRGQTDAEKAAKAPPAAAPEPAPAPNPNAQPFGVSRSDQNPAAAPANPTADAAGTMGKAFGEQAAGIKAAAAAQTDYAAQAQAAQEQLTKSLVAAKQTYDRNYAAVDAENKRLTQDVMNTKIDPTRVWSQTSTGNKVMAGIGILLSGIGSGLTGQQNMAMEVINKTIERDIDAQKAELGKKENLLSMNFHKYGNIHAAYQATAAQMYAITQGQIGAAAAKMGGQVAQANAQMAMGQLDLQRAQMQQGLAMHGVGVALGGGAGAGGRVNLENLPKDLRERAVQLPNGGVVLARDAKERGEVQDSLTSLAKIEGELDRALAFMDETGRTGWGTAANATAESIRRSLVLGGNELHGLKRMTDTEHKDYEEMTPSPGAWRQGAAKAQLMEMKNMVARKRNEEFVNHTEGYNPGRGAGRDAVLSTGGR